MALMPITGLPSILISSAEFLIERKTGDAPSALPDLKKGHILTARVLEIISGRQALLQIGNKKVLAKTFVPLKPGQPLTLEVTDAGSRSVLRLVEGARGGTDGYHGLIRSWGKEGPFEHLGRVLSKSGLDRLSVEAGTTISAGLSKLREWIAEISLQSAEVKPNFLSALIQGSGLLWEKKLLSVLSNRDGLAALEGLIDKDIKGIAMRLLSLEGENQTRHMEVLRTFIEGLENLQLYNQYADEQTGRYLLPLPVWVFGDLKFGQMLLTVGGRERNKNEKEEDSVVKISFLLTLSQLGDLRADFSVLGHVITGSLGVATPEIKAYVEPRLIELTDRLSSHGYEIRQVGCRVVEPDLLSGTALFDMAIQGAPNGVLNVVV